MRYIDIRDNLKTGDIVLFEGTGFASNFIQFFSGSKWSHVGIVVKIDELDMALIWESTTLNKVYDIIDNVPKKGVQTVAFSTRLATYDGNLAVRHLNKPITADMRTELIALRSILKDRPYEQHECELAKSLLDKFDFLENEKDLSSLFCSELVAEALQVMKLIPDAFPSNEFTPKDFDDGKWIDDLMLQGYSYGGVIDIET